MDLGHFDGAWVQDFCTEAGEFEHLIVGDVFELGGVWHDAWVAGVDAVDVGVDLADVGVDGGCNGDCGGIRTAAAKGVDLIIRTDALEACDDDNVVSGELAADLGCVDVNDARFVMGVVGADADLRAGVGHGFEAELLQGHRCQSDGDLFPGGKEHVHFAGIWHVADLIRAVCEIVGHAGWGGDDDNDVVAFALGLGDVLCHCFDAVGISDRGAAVFLYN